jgi:gamma-glutamylcyclotransferase (GGCT)/AIG2-like uncharacterized protein YtfP
MTSKYLFVYGTLSPRKAPPEIRPQVRRLRRVGKGSIKGKVFDLGSYPAAILSRSGTQIKGEVFELPDDPELLKKLDEYEEFNQARPGQSLFRRQLVSVKMASRNGKKMRAWVYVYNREIPRSL